jgi:hypothetical protein
MHVYKILLEKRLFVSVFSIGCYDWIVCMEEQNYKLFPNYCLMFTFTKFSEEQYVSIFRREDKP